MKLFVSYARVNGEQVEHLVAQLKHDHPVWVDREIMPGQTWWHEIIKQIQQCDCFIVALTPQWLTSVFCQAEFNYAHALNKPILPVEIKPIDLLQIPPALAEVQWVKGWSPHDQAIHARLLAAIPTQSTPPADLSMPVPPMPIEPLDYLKQQIHQLPLDHDQQAAILQQILAYLTEAVWNNRALALLQALHSHPNLLASLRDQIEAVTPRLGQPRFQNRHESNQFESYSDFLDKAQLTLHNFGAGLASVGPHLAGYKTAIQRGVRLYFMHLDPAFVTDATARFFSKQKATTIRREIDTTTKEHLRELYEYARGIFPRDYYHHVEVRWRETGPDIGILARDLDTSDGVMRLEFYVYDTTADHWPGLLLYPHQPLYATYQRAIQRLWWDSAQPVGAILTSPHHPNQVLLTKRTIELFKGYWCLPGGHIEVGEYKQEAILREVREEIGVGFEPHYFDKFEENFPVFDHHVWVNIFVGDLTSEAFVRQEDEVGEIRWFNLDEACAMQLAFGHEAVLRAYRQWLKAT